MVEGILHMWRLWGGVVVAILRLAMETQALPTDQTLNEPLRRHQRDFLWCHIFLYQWWTGTVCHHNIILASRNVCRWREEQTVTNRAPALYFYTAHYLDVMLWSLYLSCPCLPGTVGQRNLHPWWSAVPKAPLASQTPEGPAEPWTGCNGDAWLEREKIYVLKQQDQSPLCNIK